MNTTNKDTGKYEIIFEDEDSISIWRYNNKKTSSGPYEVEYKWKKNFNPWDNSKKKTLGELVKEQNKKTTTQKRK